MDKNLKQTKAAKAQAEEAALNRILCWVSGGAVLEFLMLLLYRYWTNHRVSEIDLWVALHTVVKVVAVAALALAAVCFVWWRSVHNRGKSVNLPATLCLTLAGISVGSFATWFFGNTGIQAMYMLVPVAVVLALIYYLYQREFFLLACQSVLALAGVWLCATGLSGTKAFISYIYVVAAALVILASAYLCYKLQAGKGVLEWDERKWKIFSKDTNYTFLYVGAVLAMLILIGAVLSLSQMVLYAVTVAWLLVMAVYYTVKLM